MIILYVSYKLWRGHGDQFLKISLFYLHHKAYSTSIKVYVHEFVTNTYHLDAREAVVTNDIYYHVQIIIDIMM